jgi:Na+/proline symporter
MISRVLFCDCLEETDEAYPRLVLNEFPKGLVGLLVASFVAAMMSSLSSTFNSGSTVITMDIYKRFINPHASEAQLVNVGRLGTLLLVGLTFCWLPVIAGNDGGLFLFLTGVTGRIQPVLATVMLIGFIWDRANAEGALAGLLVGSIIAALSLGLNLAYDCDADYDAGEPYRHWYVRMSAHSIYEIIHITLYMFVHVILN